MNEDKATRYHRHRRWAELAGTLLAGLVLALLVSGGAAFRLREVAAILGGLLPWFEGDAATVPVMAALVILVLQAVELPFSFYQGYLLEHRYGLSTQPLRSWVADHARAATLGLVAGVAVASGVYVALRWSPEWWWLVSAVLLSAALVAVTHLAPTLLLPLFSRITPLDRPPLEARLHALCARVGTRAAGVFEWHVSGHTRKASAALAGVGRTRRILLSDTLLADCSDDEVEVVLAHELSHHVHHDLWRSLALQTLILTGGFLAAHLALDAWADPLALRGRADPAGLPLLVLFGGLWWWLWLPVASAASRAHERRADRFAFETTQNPAAFISAVRRLAQQNLAEDEPPRLAALLSSHPSIRERIQAARAWPPG